jgi:hypothetical protein
VLPSGDGDCILQKKRIIEDQIVHNTISADAVSLFIYMEKLKMIAFA